MCKQNKARLPFRLYGRCFSDKFHNNNSEERVCLVI